MPSLTLATPIGAMTLTEAQGAIVALDWGETRHATPTPLLREAARQLRDYFARHRQVFDVPLEPAGTAFQRRVFAEMARIPFGRLRSYGAIARNLDSAPRAVGQACGANPLPIFIPCHRVVASGGRLGGYSGGAGLATKKFLLRLEGISAD